MDNAYVNYDLSVIIPCHNVEEFITPLLDSLNTQNLYNYKVELIFICDNCTDNTKNIIEQYLPFQPTYSGIHIFNIFESRSAKARNAGLDLAMGRNIWFVDSDDWLIDNNALAICIKTLDKHPEEEMMRFGWEYSKWFDITNRSQGQLNGMVWQYCFRRSLIGNTRFPNKQPDEDVDFINAIIAKLKTHNYISIQRKLYYYNYWRLGSNMQQFYATGRIE